MTAGSFVQQTFLIVQGSSLWSIGSITDDAEMQSCTLSNANSLASEMAASFQSPTISSSASIDDCPSSV